MSSLKFANLLTGLAMLMVVTYTAALPWIIANAWMDAWQTFLSWRTIDAP